MAWEDGVLSGRSAVVAGEPYELFLTEGGSWRLAGVECDGATALPVTREDGLVVSGCARAASGELTWRAQFEKLGTPRGR